MRIEPVICLLLLACLLSACSSPPALPEPKGVFVAANPDIPSYLPAINPSEIPHDVSSVLQTSKTNTVKTNTNKAEEGKVSLSAVKLASNRTSRPQKPETLKGVVKPTVAPLFSSGKNPFSATVSPVKSAVMPPVKPVPLPRLWTVKPGSTLKQVFMKWAGNEKCHIAQNWSVRWNTQTDYPVDLPLTFTGSFEAVTLKLFSLYRHANVPLYADVYKTQCLIIINDTAAKNKKKGR